MAPSVPVDDEPNMVQPDPVSPGNLCVRDGSGEVPNFPDIIGDELAPPRRDCAITPGILSVLMPRLIRQIVCPIIGLGRVRGVADQ
jgi:hypothetical protein